MQVKDFQEDFKYVYNTLKIHPIFQIGKNISALDKLYERLKGGVEDYMSLVNALTALTVFLEDGHTNIEIPYTTQDDCLRLICEWQEEKLVLKERYENIKAGTEIIAVEDMDVNALLEWSAHVIPHENIFLVKSRMIEYPYMNYHVFSKMNLTQLFGEKQSIRVDFLVNGEKITKNCIYEKYDGCLDFPEGNHVYYDVLEDCVTLHLEECVCDEKYVNTLSEVASLCNEKGIKSLEIDLSKNMGGSSAVIDEFMKYVDVSDFRRYEMIDYSSSVPEYITRRSDVVCNPRKDILFPKDIICRVSNATFSSARTFAVTLKDNAVARIVGQPTGGKPCSFGMPRRFVTPNCNIRFRVSRALFLRPNEKLDKEIALFPEEYIGGNCLKHLGTMFLETECLVLRKIEESDCQAMYENWASLEECSRFFPWSAATDRESYKEKVMRWIKNYENGLYFNWVIELKKNREIIGMINLHNVDEQGCLAETSYILTPKYWGNGIMTEALKRVIRFAFEDIGLKCVQADIFRENVASGRVLEKCGMKKEGVLVERYCKEGRYIDSVQYAVFKGERSI